MTCRENFLFFWFRAVRQKGKAPAVLSLKHSRKQLATAAKCIPNSIRNHVVPSSLILSTPPPPPAASSWTISNDALNESAPTDTRPCVPGAAEFFPILSQELTPIIAVCRLPSHFLPDLTYYLSRRFTASIIRRRRPIRWLHSFYLFCPPNGPKVALKLAASSLKTAPSFFLFFLYDTSRNV